MLRKCGNTFPLFLSISPYHKNPISRFGETPKVERPFTMLGIGPKNRPEKWPEKWPEK
jgi:hypothetical protein